MSTFTERLQVIIETKAQAAVSQMQAYRTSVAEAEGATAKLKAATTGLGSLFGSFANTGAGSAAIIGTVAREQLKAANAASDLGVSIGRLSDATGLSAEQASRWTEIANDMGIGSDNLAGLIEKMTKNLGQNASKFAQYGIEVRHAKDGTVDMNATLLGAIDRLHNMSDPTERAAVGAQLFGRSWAQASEIVAQGADAIQARLAAVEGMRVFSNEDIKNARDYRDAMAELHDAVQNVEIAFGKAFGPQLADAAKSIAAIGNAVDFVNSKVSKLSGGFADLFTVASGPIGLLERGVSKLKGLYDDATRKIDENARLISATAGAGMVAYEAQGSALQKLAASEAQWATETDKATAAQHAQRASVLDQQSGLVSMVDALAKVRVTLDDSKAGWVAQQQAIIGAKKSVNDYLSSLGGIPTSVLTTIDAAIDKGDLEAVTAELDALASIRLHIPIILEAGTNTYGGLGEAARNSAAHAASISDTINKAISDAQSKAAKSSGGGGGNAITQALIPDWAAIKRELESEQDIMYKVGKLSTAQYKKDLEERLKSYKQYTSDWYAAWQLLQDLTNPKKKGQTADPALEVQSLDQRIAAAEDAINNALAHGTAPAGSQTIQLVVDGKVLAQAVAKAQKGSK